jgi:hypothetical protein
MRYVVRLSSHLFVKNRQLVDGKQYDTVLPIGARVWISESYPDGTRNNLYCARSTVCAE